jgi:hypothetical protein
MENQAKQLTKETVELPLRFGGKVEMSDGFNNTCNARTSTT